MKNIIVLRYGELSLKGNNRKEFINCLVINIKAKLKSEKFSLKINKQEIMIYNIENQNVVINEMKTLFGLSRILVFEQYETLEESIQKIEEIAAQVDKPTTFRVTVKRRNKRFPKTSQEMQYEIASKLLVNDTKDNLKVSLSKYEKEFYLEIDHEHFRVLTTEYKGLGGLPTGSSGKAVALISGGIDSPVAIYEAMKRGLRVMALHFETPPYTSPQAFDKIEQLIKQLSVYDPKIKLYSYNFTQMQTFIHQNIESNSDLMVVLRNFMFEIAGEFAEYKKCFTILTGENIGQVASQTAENMRASHSGTNKLILQPLITYDKLDIIKKAEQIGTYPISNLPFEDFCTIFAPKSPTIRMDYAKMQAIKADLVEKLKQENISYLTKENITHIDWKKND
jgi:thiamine biosynthesis protein ThiI